MIAQNDFMINLKFEHRADLSVASENVVRLTVLALTLIRALYKAHVFSNSTLSLANINTAHKCQKTTLILALNSLDVAL